jgi:hypothetical protein
MKYKDLVLISIIIGVLALATYYITIEAYTLGVLLSVIAFYTLIYVIVGVRTEKRLERELRAFKLVHKETQRSRDLLATACTEKNICIKELEIDFANQVKTNDILQKRYDNLNAKDESLKDIPFSEDTYYINKWVKVKYGQQVKITQISKILDEKPIKYRCAKCGSKKYLPSDFMEFNEEDKQFIEDMKEV